MGYANAASAPQYQIVEAKDVGAYWVASPWQRRPVKYPRSAVREGVEGCVELGFSIEPDGVPAELKVLRSTFSEGASKESVEAVTQAVIDAVAAARYSPAQTNPQRLPVYTHRITTFFLSAVSRVESNAESKAHSGHIADSCKIADFKGFMNEVLKKAAP